MALNQGDKYAIAAFARHRCEATGLHHPDCPGEVHPSTWECFVIHHRYPRERARRAGVDPRDCDAYDNLLFVWNGQTPLGAGGCHGRIHSERGEAKRLGLLLDRLPSEVARK